MIHQLTTLSTTIAVMLHALLGCCVHHAHADHTHAQCVESVSEDSGCDHGHGDPQHHSDAESVGDGCSETDCQHCPGSHDPCAEPDCNIVASPRGDDVRLMLSLEMWNPLLADSILLSAHDVLGPRSAADTPPDLLLLHQPLRAQTQVWRL